MNQLKLIKKAKEKNGKTYYSYTLTDGEFSIVIRPSFDKDMKGNSLWKENTMILNHFTKISEEK